RRAHPDRDRPRALAGSPASGRFFVDTGPARGRSNRGMHQCMVLGQPRARGDRRGREGGMIPRQRGDGIVHESASHNGVCPHRRHRAGPVLFRRPLADDAAAADHPLARAAGPEQFPGADGHRARRLLLRDGRPLGTGGCVSGWVFDGAVPADVPVAAGSTGRKFNREGGRVGMEITPDSIVYWQAGPIKISATLVFTWLVMALMVLASWLVT